MKRLLFFISLMGVIFSTGCKKENEQKCDWQLVDNMGNYLSVVYNKTETELLACTNCGTFNG